MAKKNLPENASVQTQCAKILRFLKLKKSQGTTNRELSQELAILCPCKRISEMREKGIKIHDIWEQWCDEFGIIHRVKRYFYRGENS